MNNAINTLPEKWCTKLNDSSIVSFANKHGEGKVFTLTNQYYFHYPPYPYINSTRFSDDIVQPGYTEIDTEDFKKLVINS